jgi:hypothetical protein
MAKKPKQVETDPNERVDTPHPEYDRLKDMRKVVRDVICGVDALTSDLDTYLPQLEGESDTSYEARWRHATLNKYTKKAVKTMAGLVFAGEIEFDGTPAPIVALMENVDKQGNHINIFAREGFEDLLIDGYGGILTDAPGVKPQSKREQGQLDTNPYARRYTADAIWNWHHRINPISQKQELDLIVFKECTMKRVGRYGSGEVTRFRAYELEGPTVTLEVFIVDENGDPEVEIPKKIIPVSAIPFSEDGKIGTEPPLYDVARKNVEHFQTYSIFKSDQHKTCVPQRVIEGGNSESVPPTAGDVTLFPPIGAKAYFIEVEGKGLELVRQTCKDIATDIAAMTNSIINGSPVKGQAATTATQEVIDNSQETAELRPIAECYKDTLERMLGFFAEFLSMGTDKGGSVVLPTQWALQAQKEADQQAIDQQKTDLMLKGAKNVVDQGLQPKL